MTKNHKIHLTGHSRVFDGKRDDSTTKRESVCKRASSIVTLRNGVANTLHSAGPVPVVSPETFATSRRSRLCTLCWRSPEGMAAIRKFGNPEIYFTTNKAEARTW